MLTSAVVRGYRSITLEVSLCLVAGVEQVDTLSPLELLCMAATVAWGIQVAPQAPQRQLRPVVAGVQLVTEEPARRLLVHVVN